MWGCTILKMAYKAIFAGKVEGDARSGSDSEAEPSDRKKK